MGLSKSIVKAVHTGHADEVPPAGDKSGAYGDLQRKAEELSQDIGRVLHASSNVLIMAKAALEDAAGAMDAGLFPDLAVPDAAEADEILSPKATQLSQAIGHLLAAGDAERRLKALPEAKWKRLAHQADNLRQIQDIAPVLETRPHALRLIAHEINKVCREVQPGLLPREPVRDTLQAATHLEQTACLVDILTTRAAIIQMDGTLRSLRDFITSDVRPAEARAKVKAAALVDQAIAQLAQFAVSSGVDIVWRDNKLDVTVEASERDVVRALHNILHNAIKYSWRRDRSHRPWVHIRLSTQEGMACYEFENWGVPISREELHKKLYLQLGYRGEFATDRGRLGTGIGLTDANRVALAHGGDLLVDSHPASQYELDPKDDDYYHQPFLTTVTLRIPMAVSGADNLPHAAT